MQVHSYALSDGDTTEDELTITGDYTAGSKAFLRMNVDTTTHDADMLIIGGDVSGTTKLLLDFLTYDSSTQDIPLVQALNDDASTAADFTVWRVYHNPYEWETTYKDNVWYLAANDEEPEPTPPEPTPPEPTPPEPTPPEPTPPEPTPPSPKPIKVNPEIIAYYSLPEAGLEQVSSIFNNIRDKISATKIARGNDRAGRYTGGVWEDGMRCGAMNNLWVHATYDHAEITDFTDIEADIKGADFGYDVQTDLHNKLGIFASYRDGEYDLNGKGSEYYSSKGAEIDIKSWDIGMYYRYDYDYVWLQAIAYVGKQDVDISTDDGVSASTDGVEFGVGAELGKAYRLVNDFTLEPSLGVFYTQVSYDDIDDEVGNHVEYDTINRLELEAGAKLEKTFRSHNGSSKVYVKPSVIVQKTMNSSVMIDTLGEEETIDDRVLGKIQVGARIALSRALSTYGHVNFRFGDDYEALSGILGLNYAW
jgi:outer membrane autotransporter protein